MINNALLFLVEAILGLITFAFLLRFYLQLCKAPFQNQFAQLIVTLTNFAVKPARRVLPSLGKIDISTFVLAWLSQLLMHVLALLLKEFPLFVAGYHIWPLIAGVSLLGVISSSISIFLYAVLIQAVLSWVNPHSPASPALISLTNPVLRPLRKIIPPAGGFDLSPLAFIILAQLVLTTILLPIENGLLAGL